ncbi:hypothetical protein BDA96_05G123100 [Sorghum bicolor]|uniref:CRIB domain-containing protein n=2 Tax=Sorghum bicolor TaxID=4558 RepID=A0A921QWM5_SORBI|nr:uncharacterized protein LOC8071852 isoform X2 [Sorghum bicolor]EES08442.1 hypothetical protein SORBI_3005G112000 [Sorghum bicolor]KAG0529733.1 hypothetical protein BDA96_05G123100 [Sorghum bicolor]|eukprot:XP_002449454.1 uncharacterized protein LOC8071852 isoform X2 [Sorghum bicolor]
MTPISEQQHNKEPETQSSTSRSSPVPNEVAVVGDEENADHEQQQQVARRDRDFLAGIRKLFKSFKNLSHIFEIYKDEDEEEDDDDTSIEIGLPTDVQHVAHIGLDGSTNLSSLRGLQGARELFSLSNLTTLEQFELTMASLAATGKERNGVLDRVSRN